MQESWEELGERAEPSWYLDPLVARQKREVHLAFFRRWLPKETPGAVLKTDLFEDAFGDDRVLPGLFPYARLVCGIDLAHSTVRAASRRDRQIARGASVHDVRGLGFRDSSFDLVISTSTLDHFQNRAAYLESLAEITRVLRPGGTLFLTMDNPWNPLYWPLRLWCGWRAAPFFLGYTPSARQLRQDLRVLGFEIHGQDWLIHNPRLLSTALFLTLRRALGRRAEAPIAALLSVFALSGKLPSRPLTACFSAIAARRESHPALPLP